MKIEVYRMVREAVLLDFPGATNVEQAIFALK